MNRDAVCDFVDDWIEAWNARDVERVLGHFTDDAVFTSPKALETVGSATVRGKAAMRDYWAKRTAVIRSLRFTLDHFVFDDETRQIHIVYEAAIDGRRVRACEMLRFGDDGHAVAGEAMYGAPL